MAAEIPLVLQTAYADLLDRAASAAFDEAFAEDGVFTPKDLRGRRYWYFQASTNGGRQQHYVGRETPELLERIARHKETRESKQQRQILVSTLVRSARLPRPPPQIGDVVAALAKAGVFRLRGVLVGTVAYQTYAAMLGTRLPEAAIQTGDIDVAQFADVSAAVGDRMPAILDVLWTAEPSFRPVLHLQQDHVVSYESSGGIRVDFLTPNRGPDTETPRFLPAFGTDAQPLRFLDFLIVDPEPAVLLHGPGIYVSVPEPQRYAIHKLIVACRRRVGDVKRDKDVQQAETLLSVLSRKQPNELRAAWHEACDRGKSWKRLLGQGLGLIQHPDIRDRILAVVGANRSIIPGLELTFSTPHAMYDPNSGGVTFFGKAGVSTVRCIARHEALEARAGDVSLDAEGCLRRFRVDREIFERIARRAYLTLPVEVAGVVTIGSADVARPP